MLVKVNMFTLASSPAGVFKHGPNWMEDTLAAQFVAGGYAAYMPDEVVQEVSELPDGTVVSEDDGDGEVIIDGVVSIGTGAVTSPFGDGDIVDGDDDVDPTWSEDEANAGPVAPNVAEAAPVAAEAPKEAKPKGNQAKPKAEPKPKPQQQAPQVRKS